MCSAGVSRYRKHYPNNSAGPASQRRSTSLHDKTLPSADGHTVRQGPIRPVLVGGVGLQYDQAEPGLGTEKPKLLVAMPLHDAAGISPQHHDPETIRSFSTEQLELQFQVQ